MLGHHVKHWGQKGGIKGKKGDSKTDGPSPKAEYSGVREYQ